MGGPEGRFVQGDVDRQFGVGSGLGAAPLRRALTHAAEEHVEDVLDRARAKGVARADVRAEAVVVGAPFWVRQDLVGLAHLFEARLGRRIAGIGVGVVLARESPVGLLQVLG